MIIKIASWNIAGGRKINSLKSFDYDKENLTYFVEKISHLNVDILCIQETHSNKNRIISEEMAKYLKFNYVFDTPQSPSHIDDDFELGNAIISKFPLEDCISYQYPDPEFKLYWADGQEAKVHHKNVQAARINDFWIANTQMLPLGLFGYSYQKGDGYNFAGKLEKTLINLKTPLIFCGDINFNDPSKIYKSFMNLKKLKESLPDFTTRPEDDSKKRTPDHIFYSPEFKLISSDVIKTETDHYLCVAEFSLF